MPSERGGQPRPRSVLVVSHHLDGLLLRDRVGLLRPTHDPGLRRVSPGCDAGIPATRSRPSELCSPNAARDAKLVSQPRHPGLTSPSSRRCRRRSVHREPYPPAVASTSACAAASGRPQGLAPRSERELAAVLPPRRALCSPGLDSLLANCTASPPRACWANQRAKRG